MQRCDTHRRVYRRNEQEAPLLQRDRAMGYAS